MVERGQGNKQGRMDKEANQLYWRPQMTGQVRGEEEEVLNIMQYGIRCFYFV